MNTKISSTTEHHDYLAEDLADIAASKVVMAHLSDLQGRTVLITGATGLIGSLLARSFVAINDTHHTGMGIYLVLRSRDKAEQIYGTAFLSRPDIHIIQDDITDPSFVGKAVTALDESMPELSGTLKNTAAQDDVTADGESTAAKVTAAGDAGAAFDYIFHAAAITASKVMVTKPIETIDASLKGTKNLLELAAASGTRSFVYISSMEVYGDMSAYEELYHAKTAALSAQSLQSGSSKKADVIPQTDGTSQSGSQKQSAEIAKPVPQFTVLRETDSGRFHAREDTLGCINPQAVRSDYPESKRMCENMCTAYLAEKNVPVKTARLAQTFGAGILPWENRVFAQFARAVQNGEDIVLHTRGLSEGNYCYSADCMKGLLTILLEGTNGEAYNVANEACHTTIAGMAHMVAETFGNGRTHVVFDIPETNTYGYAADTKLYLDSSKLRALGWTPTVDLPHMYQRLLGSI